jgi:MraZ protein
MLLTGTYLRSLDEKQRFALPKRLRECLGQTPELPLYLTPGTDGSLALYTEEAFNKLGQQLSQGSPAGQDTRAFSRLFYAQAQSVDVDAQGRVRIPAELAQLAGLEKEIMLLGVRDHLEIWDKGRWNEYLQSLQPRYDQLAERAFEQSTGSGRQTQPVFATAPEPEAPTEDTSARPKPR